MKVKEGENDDEYIITRLGHTNPAINIINIYGGIEDKMEDEEVIGNWERVKRDLEDIQSRNESTIIIGDLNRAIGADQLGVKGNKPKISKGGRMVRELLEEGEYVLLNNTEKAVGGPWTWVSRSEETVKSCLDLVIVSADLEPFLESMTVDTEFKYGPARVRKVNNKLKKIHSDHFPMVVRFQNLPTKRIVTTKAGRWKLNVPEGWKSYQRLSDKISGKMDDIIDNKALSIEEVTKKVEALHTKIQFQAFGKSKPPTAKAKTRGLEKRKRYSSGMMTRQLRNFSSTNQNLLKMKST